MNVVEKSWSVVVLAIVMLIALLSGVSCAAPAAAPAPTTQGNGQPVIEQINGSSDWSPLTEGQFACIASDPDGDNLTYKWAADNGTVSGSGAIMTWVSPSVMGKYKITVTVSDGKGGEATAVQEARVIINADGSVSADAPVVLQMAFPSKEVVTGAKRVRIWTASPVECLVEGSDAKNLKFTWSAASGRLQAAKGMNLTDGTASRVNWIAPGVGGDFTVDVVVTDGRGNEAKGTVNFKVFCCGN
jgi:hypothetical protein